MTLEFAGKQTVWNESVAGLQEVTFEISDLVVRLPPGLKPCDSWRLYFRRFTYYRLSVGGSTVPHNSTVGKRECSHCEGRSLEAISPLCGVIQQNHLERKYTILFPENQVRKCLLRLWSSSQGSAFAIINQGRIDIPICQPREDTHSVCCP